MTDEVLRQMIDELREDKPPEPKPPKVMRRFAFENEHDKWHNAAEVVPPSHCPVLVQLDPARYLFDGPADGQHKVACYDHRPCFTGWKEADRARANIAHVLWWHRLPLGALPSRGVTRHAR